MFVLLSLILYVPVNALSANMSGVFMSSWTETVLTSGGGGGGGRGGEGGVT